jgi:uncharacterized protein (UPF0333 family)
MRKIAVFAVVLAFVLVSGCGPKYYAVSITNESSKTVSYTYNGSDDTLAPNDSKTYEVLAYTQAPKNINFPGALSVKMTRNGDIFTFENIPLLTLM